MTITDLSHADIAFAPSEPPTCRFDGIAATAGTSGGRRHHVVEHIHRHLCAERRATAPGALGVHRHRASRRPGWGPQAQTFRATLALGDRIETATATATGPVAALTAMLYEHGVAVEMLRFHQLRSDDTTATFIQGSDGCRAEWAMGCSEDPTQSALSAVIACANRLYGESA